MSNDLGFTNFSDPFSFGEGIDPIYLNNSAYGQDTIEGWLNRTFDPKGFNLWQSYQDKLYERQSVNSARAWDLWFDSTSTQRRVADLKKAGLNPWLAVSNGGVSTFSQSSANQGGNARFNTNIQKLGLGNILIGVAALLKAFV